MNLDEFLARKAEEEKAKTETPTEQTQTPVVVTPVVPVVAPVVPEVTQPTPTVTPDKITIDGKEYTTDEIKAGFLRTEDYTRKTQEAARVRREAQDALRVMQQVRASNPQAVEQLGIQLPDEGMTRQQALEDQLVEREVELLSIKYPDFNVQEALQMATSRPGLNLEDAYLIGKSRSTPPVAGKEATQLDIEEVKKQLRQELLQEIQANQSATQTIITPNDSVVTSTSTEPTLSEAEKEFCKKSRTPEAEYIKMKQDMRRK